MMVVVTDEQVKTRYPKVKEAKGENLVVCDCECGVNVKQPPSPPPPSPPPRRAPKAVDEDLYKISPELLRAKPTKVSLIICICYLSYLRV